MENTKNARSQWSLQDNVGQLTYGPLSGEVHAAQARFGLRAKSLGTDRLLCSLLGACRSAQSLSAHDSKSPTESSWWPLPIAETYLRGNDFVATYQAVDTWPYSPQLYWRTETLDAVEGVVSSISLLVSVQTHLLDTCPQISVTSQVPGKETIRIDVDEAGDAKIESVRTGSDKVPIGATCCVIRRLATAPLSYVEIMSSADGIDVQINANASTTDSRTEWRLFADFLEKGVIRRARVHGALVPRENDVAIATECCKAAAQLELPLTT